MMETKGRIEVLKWLSPHMHAMNCGAIVLTALLSLFPLPVKAVPLLTISQFPLELAAPTPPQVLFAIANSESMDGTLSGAIMVGSGALSASLNSLQNSSSPVNYTVPPNFTPPLQAANASGLAPYTVTLSGTLYDNGPSRLNVAKAGVKAILDAYMQNTDFALETYNVSSIGAYTTWVYYMSPQSGNFAFTNTQISGNRYVINPCFGYTTASSTVLSNCTSIAALYTAATLSTNQYMQIGSSSDDPTINDILYAGGLPGIFVTYTGPSPASPYPPNFSLSNYNNGSILLSYTQSRPNIGGFATGPTNAGFVPFSPQVMYSERGFGYYGSQSASSGTIKVPMKTAGVPPTIASVATAINAFVPFLNPETNNSSSTEIKSSAVQAPMAGLLTTAKTYLTGLPTPAVCAPKRYVVFISDGLPTQSLNGAAWPPLGSAAGTGYGVTATFNPDGSLNTTNDQALTDTITALTNLKNANINTYVIGLGAGVDPTVNAQAAATLTAMAVAGNTVNYYPATSPTDLVNNLNSILIALQNASLSTTATTVSSTFLQAGDVEYQTSFNSSTSPYQDWTGNVSEQALNISTGLPTGTTLWAAQSLLDAQAARLIATWNPASNGGTGDGVPFAWANLSPTQQGQLQPSDALGTSRLLYLRGNTSLEKRNGGTFRNRSHILGDIINSQPAYVGPPSNAALAISSASYVAYMLANTNRSPMLYAGSNDGMLHAFNASTGVEQFAFIPNGVFSKLYNLTTPLYNQNHLFFVDGSPGSADVQFSDGNWHTILVGGENAGGMSIYAMDISQPTNLSSEALLANAILWEFADADMGLSYSQPQIGQINTSGTTMKFAVFFGNGYNSPTNKTILYAINPENGLTLAKIDLCAAVPSACNAALPNGLSTVALGQSDGLQGQPITVVYAGDLQGNMWAINVINSDPASWTARVLFQARDSSGVAQPITTQPAITLNPSYPRLQGLFVMFGTGQFLTQSDLTSTQTQSVYGVWDKPANAGTILTRANLQAQTLTLVTAATSGLSKDILMDTSLAVNWGTNAGWYTDLPIPGQRVITNPILINGSFITTLNTPPATPCGAATSMFLNINYQTGGAFPLPQLDINGDGIINLSDQSSGLNPVGIGLWRGYSSAPTYVGKLLHPPSGSTNTNGSNILHVTGADGAVIQINTTNNNYRQTGWWQIQ